MINKKVLSRRICKMEVTTNTEKRVPIISFISDEEKKKIEASKKKYLILLWGEEESTGVEYNIWKYATGRQNAYDFIRDTLCDLDIADSNITFNAFKSRIIVESDSGKIKLTGISVYRFMKQMKLEHLVEDDSDFDIEEWKVDEEIGNTEQHEEE